MKQMITRLDPNVHAQVAELAKARHTTTNRLVTDLLHAAIVHGKYGIGNVIDTATLDCLRLNAEALLHNLQKAANNAEELLTAIEIARGNIPSMGGE